jgi:hypothetical protein
VIWNPEVEYILQSAGWHKGRWLPNEVKKWKETLSSPKGFETNNATETALLESGDFKVVPSGLGFGRPSEQTFIEQKTLSHTGVAS